MMMTMMLTNNWEDVDLWVRSEMLYFMGDIRISFMTSRNYCHDSYYFLTLFCYIIAPFFLFSLGPFFAVVAAWSMCTLSSFSVGFVGVTYENLLFEYCHNRVHLSWSFVMIVTRPSLYIRRRLCSNRPLIHC